MRGRLWWATAAVLILFACAPGVRAQDEGAPGGRTADAEEGARGTRVPLAQAATAFNAVGREALSATLLTQALAGTPEAPVRNVRLVVRNAGGAFYNYAAGYATFYDEGGVRCGTGLFTFGAAEPDERVEVDTPGLRLTCTPASWRVVATALLTAAGDVAQPGATQTPSALPGAPAPPVGALPEGAVPPLEINVNGKTIPIQLGNPLDIQVGNERVRIVVRPAP